MTLSASTLRSFTLPPPASTICQRWPAPDVADQLAPYPSDLVLAGHTHGRQVALKVFDPYILPPYGRNYVKGLYDLPGDRSLYVTAGLGTTQLPLRFGSFRFVTIQR